MSVLLPRGFGAQPDVEYVAVETGTSPIAGVASEEAVSQMLVPGAPARPRAALTAFRHPRPAHAVRTIAGVSVTFVADGDPDGRFYDCLFVDRDGDGDLHDEPPVSGFLETPGENTCVLRFPAVDLSLPGPRGTRIPYRLRPTVFCYDREGWLAESAGDAPGRPFSGVSLQLEPACAYRGTFAAGGIAWEVAFVDADLDGRIGTFFSCPAVASGTMSMPVSRLRGRYEAAETYGDCLYVARSGARVGTRIPLTPHLILGEQAFRVEVRETGETPEFAEIRDGLFPARLPGTVRSLVLCSSDGTVGVAAVGPPSGRIDIPAGRWGVQSYTLEREDAATRWTLTARATSGMLSVAVGETSWEPAVLPFGEPFRPVVYVLPWEADRVYRGATSDVPLRCALVGAGNEVVRALDGVSDGANSRSGRPAYRIRDAAGDLVARGVFDYG